MRLGHVSGPSRPVSDGPVEEVDTHGQMAARHGVPLVHPRTPLYDVQLWTTRVAPSWGPGRTGQETVSPAPGEPGDPHVQRRDWVGVGVWRVSVYPYPKRRQVRAEPPDCRGDQWCEPLMSW